jgi:outer membrane protein OmpA-like peptidoglycan-associated protein
MKRFILSVIFIAAFGMFDHAQAQFKTPELAWGFQAGGAHGDNYNGDSWGMQARGFLQYELISPMLMVQGGLGYTELSAPERYFAKTGIADIRFLFSPFSLANLNPYVYAGIGVSKALNTNNSEFLPMVPFGAGIQTRISNGVLLGVNGGYNLSLSDKLDGRPRSESDRNSLTNQKNDGYFGFALGLSFNLSGGYDEEAELKAKESAEANARRLEAEETARHTKELTDAEALRVKGLSDAEAVRMKGLADAEAVRMKGLSDAEALRVKELSDAEARRLAEQKTQQKDTIIILEKGKTVVLRGVNFESNKATLTAGSAPILMQAYHALIANADAKIVITGHTDNVGSEKSNQTLSLKRAQSVRAWLVQKGIASNRMRTVGRGPNEPVSSNETKEGRSENRRIEFYVQ